MPVSAHVSSYFNYIKVLLKCVSATSPNSFPIYFNSIKVQLKPIIFGYIISLFSIGLVNAKLRNPIEKMSMGDYIFSCVLRQLQNLLVLQQVKDLNEGQERMDYCQEKPHRQLFITKNCRSTFSLSQVFVCPYYNLFYL